VSVESEGRDVVAYCVDYQHGMMRVIPLNVRDCVVTVVSVGRLQVVMTVQLD
jgi:hypothetical protein